MKITFYEKDGVKSFSLSSYPTTDSRDGAQVWLSKDDGDGMQCDSGEIASLIYYALNDYFESNYY